MYNVQLKCRERVHGWAQVFLPADSEKGREKLWRDITIMYFCFSFKWWNQLKIKWSHYFAAVGESQYLKKSAQNIWRDTNRVEMKGL